MSSTSLASSRDALLCPVSFNEETDLDSSTNALPPPRDDVPSSGMLATPVQGGFFSSSVSSAISFGPLDTSIFNAVPVPVQACEIGMVGHLGLPHGLAIGDDDGADVGVPRGLTRLFHPPER